MLCKWISQIITRFNCTSATRSFMDNMAEMHKSRTLWNCFKQFSKNKTQVLIITIWNINMTNLRARLRARAWSRIPQIYIQFMAVVFFQRQYTSYLCVSHRFWGALNKQIGPLQFERAHIALWMRFILLGRARFCYSTTFLPQIRHILKLLECINGGILCTFLKAHVNGLFELGI